MADYVRAIGASFCGLVSIAQGAYSIDRLSKYHTSKNILTEISNPISELSDIIIESAIDTAESLSYSPDLYHGIYTGIASVVFAGISVYFARAKDIEE
jgi:hypothetical protein